MQNASVNIRGSSLHAAASSSSSETSKARMSSTISRSDVHRCPLLKWNSDPKVITLIEQISESRLACCADLILIVENPRYAGIAMALSWSGEKGKSLIFPRWIIPTLSQRDRMSVPGNSRPSHRGQNQNFVRCSLKADLERRLYGSNEGNLDSRIVGTHVS